MSIESIFHETDFLYNDSAKLFKQKIKNPSKYIKWSDIEYCINRPEIFELELIDKFGRKLQIPKYNKAWTHFPIYEKSFIANHVNLGYSLVILNYASYSHETYDLVNTFENNFDVNAAIHVYCGLENSNSFNIHTDYPSNFILQVEGRTLWKIFENKHSSLLSPRFDIEDKNLKIDIEVILEPGDVLYIPSNTYHCAYPSEKRISISVPCWNRVSSFGKIDRNYYKLNY